jgi:hypothetical protein
MAVPGRPLTRFLRCAVQSRNSAVRYTPTGTSPGASRAGQIQGVLTLVSGGPLSRLGQSGMTCPPLIAVIGVAGPPRWAPAFIGKSVGRPRLYRGRPTPEIRPKSGNNPGGTSHHLRAAMRAAGLRGMNGPGPSGRVWKPPDLCGERRGEYLCNARGVHVTTFPAPKRPTRLLRPMPRRSGIVTRGARKQHKPFVRPQRMETS